MLSLLFDAYSLVVFAAVVVSWIRLPEDHPVVRWIHALTEPLLAPIRRFVPTIGGVDFSPMLLLFFVRALRKVLLV